MANAFSLSSSQAKAAAAINPAVTRLIAAVLGAGLLVWGGLNATRAGKANRADLRRAKTTLATFADWRKRYMPAVAAESIAWRRTLMELHALGVIGDERLTLTQAIARAAEGAGLRDVRVLIVTADTTGSDARLSTEGVRRQSAPFGLVVECRGNLQAVVTFLGELPSSVAPTTLSLVRQDGRARHRLSLAVYELQFSNGPPTLWSPLERSDPPRVGVSRVGG
jgi:hypothetical protein